MSLYDAVKDVLKLAQKIDNVELNQRLLDVQQQALEMQEKQFRQNKRVEELERAVKQLKAKKNLTYEEGHDWIVDPAHPDRKLCPVCFNRDDFENPMEIFDATQRYCQTCNAYVC